MVPTRGAVIDSYTSPSKDDRVDVIMKRLTK